MLPIFLVLTIGMISGGFAFERWIAVTQGTREAARYGATLDVTAVSPPGPTSQVAKVAAVAREATGVSVATPGQSVCVALFYAGSWTRQKPDGTTDNTYCWDDGRSDERVQVMVQRSTDFNWVFANNTISIGSRSVTRYEHGLT
jgi:Flp pilus assembly protein TadG